MNTVVINKKEYKVPMEVEETLGQLGIQDKVSKELLFKCRPFLEQFNSLSNVEATTINLLLEAIEKHLK